MEINASPLQGDRQLRLAVDQHHRPAEVTFSGTVASEPVYFHSTRSGLTHEAFDVRTPSGLRAQVVENVDVGPRVPVHRGDAVTVRGEYVRDAGATHVVHWTHHDPSGRHAGGFIEAGGRRYA
ncbi:MAG TPA: DUF3465 domain-containing protein [Candidatus Dormibacteraeota bacterium]|nr:DUF3465 domain-containing protein [Candidatus Dormibacteraeota bacterium]